MVDKLLIRAYNVGVGDCIYVRIPKARKKGSKVDDFHILIDCGKKGSAALLKVALDHLKTELPSEGGKKRLDLLLISHEHEDHIKGFDPDWFDDIKIENLWMSVAMNRDHPQAKFAHQLHDMAATAMRNIAARGLALSPELEDIVDRYSIGNDGAVDALRKVLPKKNGIDPLYVHADLKPADLKPKTLSGATFKVLGSRVRHRHLLSGRRRRGDPAWLRRLDRPARTRRARPCERLRSRQHQRIRLPAPAIAHDVERLRLRRGGRRGRQQHQRHAADRVARPPAAVRRRRRMEQGLPREEEELRLEHRLEAPQGELDKPVDFLKIGHHGSINSTPWNDKEDGAVTEPSTILDAILPLPKGNAKPKAKAIVSTERTLYKVIPRATLLSRSASASATPRRI